MKPLEHIITNFFTDENGNPQAEHMINTYTVSPVYNQVLLEGIADQRIGVEVLKPDGMYEVFNIEEITENSYYVKDYKTVYFHPCMANKKVTIEYFNIGLELIGADRIYTDVDQKGNVIETLASLIQKMDIARDSLQSLSNIGNVDYLIEKLERYILRCGQLHNSMETELIKHESIKNDMSNLVEEGNQIITKGLEMGVFDNQELQRKQNEKERIEEFSKWGGIETQRENNEKERIDNENQRVINENDRIDYINNTVKPNMKKVKDWDNYFKEVTPELEKKYTDRLNAVEKESSDNVKNTTDKLSDYQTNIDDFKKSINDRLIISKNITVIENDSLLNGFANYDEQSKLKYYKNLDNEIVLEGILSGGTSNSLITTLPDGFKPENEIISSIPVEKDTGFEISFIKVAANGEITFIGEIEGIKTLRINNIRFRGKIDK